MIDPKPPEAIFQQRWKFADGSGTITVDVNGLLRAEHYAGLHLVVAAVETYVASITKPAKFEDS